MPAVDPTLLDAAEKAAKGAAERDLDEARVAGFPGFIVSKSANPPDGYSKIGPVDGVYDLYQLA